MGSVGAHHAGRGLPRAHSDPARPRQLRQPSSGRGGVRHGLRPVAAVLRQRHGGEASTSPYHFNLLTLAHLVLLIGIVGRSIWPSWRPWRSPCPPRALLQARWRARSGLHLAGPHHLGPSEVGPSGGGGGPGHGRRDGDSGSAGGVHRRPLLSGVHHGDLRSRGPSMRCCCSASTPRRDESDCATEPVYPPPSRRADGWPGSLLTYSQQHHAAHSRRTMTEAFIYEAIRTPRVAARPTARCTASSP